MTTKKKATAKAKNPAAKKPAKPRAKKPDHAPRPLPVADAKPLPDIVHTFDAPRRERYDDASRPRYRRLAIAITVVALIGAAVCYVF